MKERGFTITELLIYIVLVTIVGSTIFFFGFDLYISNIKESVRAEMSIDASLILNQLSQEIRYGTEVRSTNLLTDANEPGGGWQTGNTNGELVVAYPATDSNDEFIEDTFNGGPLLNENVYFGDDGFFYRRTLANDDEPGNTAITTCPEAQAGPSCPEDSAFSGFFVNVDYTFYDQDDAEITTNLENARSLEMVVNLEREVFGEDISVTTLDRMTLRNYGSGLP